MQPIESRDDSASGSICDPACDPLACGSASGAQQASGPKRAAAARFLSLLARHPERDLEAPAAKWARALVQALRRIGRRLAREARDVVGKRTSSG